MTPELEQKLKEIHERTRYQRSYRRAYKLALLEEFGVCFHCGIPVKDYGRPKWGIRTPDDEATIDHLVSRFHRKKGEIVLKVLSCYGCNGKRCLEENKLYNENHKKAIELQKMGVV